MKRKIKKIGIIVLIITTIITSIILIYKVFKYINNLLPNKFKINTSPKIDNTINNLEAISIQKDEVETKEMIILLIVGLLFGFLFIQLLNFL